jgi:hypothetical protein
MRIRRRHRPHCTRGRGNRSPLQFHAEYAARRLSPHFAVEERSRARQLRRRVRTARCRRTRSPPGIPCNRTLPDRSGGAPKGRRRPPQRLGYGLGQWSGGQRMPFAAQPGALARCRRAQAFPVASRPLAAPAWRTLALRRQRSKLGFPILGSHASGGRSSQGSWAVADPRCFARRAAGGLPCGAPTRVLCLKVRPTEQPPRASRIDLANRCSIN